MGHFAKAAAALATIFISAPAFAAWEPSKPVEIVVAAGAGGASDQMARMMQAAIQKNNLMKQPIVKSLKGGVRPRRSADAYEIERRRSEQGADRLFADLHAAAVGKDPLFNWRDLTPVAVVALDQFVLWITPRARRR